MRENQPKPSETTEESILYADHLLPFERVPLREEKPVSAMSDEALNSKYVKGEVRIITEQARYPLAGILEMLNEKVLDDNGNQTDEPRYKLDPDYQRRHRWSNTQKSLLIESFLMNVPVPPIFLYEQDLARFEVMDGRQRLTALKEFYEDKLELTDLQYWRELNGRTYSTLPTKIRAGIDRRYISSIILLHETAKNEEEARHLKQIVFERLNTGGEKLSNQETRNAVNGGPFNDLCRELSKLPKFRLMWNIPEKLSDDTEEEEEEEDTANDEVFRPSKIGENLARKMEDVELVLRFFAYRKIGEFRKGLNKIAEFLDLFITIGNSFSSDALETYRNMFTQTVDFVYALLGQDAFSILDEKRHRPSKIIYDPLMFVASSNEITPLQDKLLERKKYLRTALNNMYNKNKTVFSGRSTNTEYIPVRNNEIRNVFLSVANME